MIDHILDNYIVNEKGCHVYQGSLNSDGYPRFHTTAGEILLHNYILEKKIGHKVVGVSDHTCRNHACINADHLEDVSNGTNVLRGEGITAKNARKTHCPKGHEYSFRKRQGRKKSRYCKICNAVETTKRYRLANPKAVTYLKRSNQSKG